MTLCFVFVSCNNILTQKDNFRKSVLDKAVVHFSIQTAGVDNAQGVSNACENKARYTYTAQNIDDEDIAKITLTVKKIKDKNGDELSTPEETAKEWVKSADESALETFSKDCILTFDEGTYNFTLNIYTSTDATSSSGWRISQTATCEYPLVAGDNNIQLSTEFVKNGSLDLTFIWSTDFALGKIEAGLFSEQKPDTAVYDYESLTINSGEDEYTANYSKSDVTNGYYYLKFILYGTDPLTGDYVELNRPYNDLVQIKGYKTKHDVLVDTDNLNTFHTVRFVLNEGSWADGSSNSYRDFSRNTYASYELPDSQTVIREGYVFNGWVDCDKDGNILEISEDEAYNFVTRVEAGDDSDHYFKAIWQEQDNTIRINYYKESMDSEDKYEFAGMSSHTPDTTTAVTETELSNLLADKGRSPDEIADIEFGYVYNAEMSDYDVDAKIITLYFSRRTVSYTFNAAEGSFGNNITSKTVDGKFGSALELEPPTKEGYTLSAWDVTYDLGEMSGTLPATATLESLPETFGPEYKAIFTARWTANPTTSSINIDSEQVNSTDLAKNVYLSEESYNASVIYKIGESEADSSYSGLIAAFTADDSALELNLNQTITAYKWYVNGNYYPFFLNNTLEDDSSLNVQTFTKTSNEPVESSVAFDNSGKTLYLDIDGLKNENSTIDEGTKINITFVFTVQTASSESTETPVSKDYSVSTTYTIPE